MSKKIEDKVEEFKLWVDYIPEYLHNFLEKNKILKERLDYSIDSLDFLESYLIENISITELKKQGVLHERLAMYIGESFIKNIEDAYWDIDFEKEKNLFRGLPVIKRYNRKGLEDCPFYMVMTAIKRKNGTFLSSLLRKMGRKNG